MSNIPELPGTIIPKNSGQGAWLRNQVATLCKINHDRSVSRSEARILLKCHFSFPGSQPVSFGNKDLERLEQNE